MVLLNFGRIDKLREDDWGALERPGFWITRYGDRRETRLGWDTSSEVLRVLRERTEEKRRNTDPLATSSPKRSRRRGQKASWQV